MRRPTALTHFTHTNVVTELQKHIANESLQQMRYKSSDSKQYCKHYIPMSELREDQMAWQSRGTQIDEQDNIFCQTSLLTEALMPIH